MVFSNYSWTFLGLLWIFSSFLLRQYLFVFDCTRIYVFLLIIWISYTDLLIFLLFAVYEILLALSVYLWISYFFLAIQEPLFKKWGVGGLWPAMGLGLFLGRNYILKHHIYIYMSSRVPHTRMLKYSFKQSINFCKDFITHDFKTSFEAHQVFILCIY